MLKFIAQADLLDDPGAPGRHPPHVLMMRQIEGNPFRKSERAVPEAVQRNLERKFNLDEPWYLQYVYYVKGVFDVRPRPVARCARPRRQRHRQDALPDLVELGVYAFLFAFCVGIPLGVIAALRHNT